MECSKNNAALDRILELTFHDAVNGHINADQVITREQINEVYELARKLRWPSADEALDMS